MILEVIIICFWALLAAFFFLVKLPLFAMFASIIFLIRGVSGVRLETKNIEKYNHYASSGYSYCKDILLGLFFIVINVVFLYGFYGDTDCPNVFGIYSVCYAIILIYSLCNLKLWKVENWDAFENGGKNVGLSDFIKVYVLYQPRIAADEDETVPGSVKK